MSKAMQLKARIKPGFEKQCACSSRTAKFYAGAITGKNFALKI